MADKPKLIKFSCPTCGTRLAVPQHLAGVADLCPKCGAMVTSPEIPAPPPVESPRKPKPVPSMEQPALWLDLPLSSPAPLPLKAPEPEPPVLEEVLLPPPASEPQAEVVKEPSYFAIGDLMAQSTSTVPEPRLEREMGNIDFRKILLAPDRGAASSRLKRLMIRGAIVFVLVSLIVAWVCRTSWFGKKSQAEVPKAIPAATAVPSKTEPAPLDKAAEPEKSAELSKPPPALPVAEVPVAKPVMANKTEVSSVPSEVAPALAALKGFLDAADSRERLQWCQKPDRIGSAMEKYYQTHASGPIRAARIDFLQRNPGPDGAPPYCMFEVDGGDFTHPVLALVEQPSEKEARVDWEALTEFKDDVLGKFFQTRDAASVSCRAMLRRKHYYDKDVPDMELKDSFEIFLPRSDFTAHVFLPVGSAAQSDLSEKLPWDMELAVIVELVWRKKDNLQWVEIASVSRYGWKT